MEKGHFQRMKYCECIYQSSIIVAAVLYLGSFIVFEVGQGESASI